MSKVSQGETKNPTVNYNGNESAVFRGENDFTIKSNKIKIDPTTGNVKTHMVYH